MQTPEIPAASEHGPTDFLSGIVRIFLESNLSIMLIVFSLLAGIAALLVTPREEDPQIVVPLADVFVQFPGHSAAEVEQLISTPLERVLYQIDGVEYVYSMSRDHEAVITVRFLVGEDRERSLVKLFKKLDENVDIIPAGVSGWVVKPVEIDDVPIVTLTLTGADDDTHALRRVAEESIQRLAVIPHVSRTNVIGGEAREILLEPEPDRMRGYQLSLLDLQRALSGANVALPAGRLVDANSVTDLQAAAVISSPDELQELVVGVFEDRPVYLKDVVRIEDGPGEVSNYVRHGFGPAREFRHPEPAEAGAFSEPSGVSRPAVTLAISKQKGANAVTVADDVLQAVEELRKSVIPDNVEILVTRNYGRSADEKVNELVEGLGIAIIIVIALLTLSLGWREAFIVAVAVPVVFGLTLTVNLLFGYTINRVTLFALILALGLLVDDPIVDVENIARHFEEKKRASRRIVLEAVAEIRPPLISATLAVIVSFLPMFFITGMMGPYMSPMALNVPVSMFMSMVVAFTITPWLCYHLLRGKAAHEGHTEQRSESPKPQENQLYDPAAVQRSLLYRFFRPIMIPILKTKFRALLFLAGTALITVAAASMGLTRSVPLKMLPFDNRNEFLIVLDLPEDASLEQTDQLVGAIERTLVQVPEVTEFTSYTGIPGPIDFNGLVRHYGLRQSPNLAEIRVNLTGKKNRNRQSHAITLALRNELAALGAQHNAVVRLVEIPPGPPVLASVVAEVYGLPDHTYSDLLDAGDRVAARLRSEAGLVEVDSIRESRVIRMDFVTDQEKAALAGVSVAEIAQTLKAAVDGITVEILRLEHERQPLQIRIQLPQALRAHVQDLGQLHAKSVSGAMVPLAELGTWKESLRGQTIYHKNLERVVYVFAECAGRTPAECIMDVSADQVEVDQAGISEERPVEGRTFFNNGAGILWSVPQGIRVSFSGEGEWNITLDVFRDLGLAFAAAMLMIYIILVAQTGSFLLPIVVMLAIPLTIIGVMPGFWMLNLISGDVVGGYADPVYFTATAMIGMIALAGIVTRDSIILVDFIELAIRHGRPLFEAILESRVVRLRPILLTAGAALLSSIPITFDPIFSGLGWSLIFGLISSTVFTLFVIPVTYWLLKAKP